LQWRRSYEIEQSKNGPDGDLLAEPMFFSSVQNKGEKLPL